MRTSSSALAAIALTLGVVAPAMAHPSGDVLPPLTVDLTHESTDNVAFVARFHEHFGSAGGIKTSNDWNDGAEFFVVTDPRGVFTYDISNPESPVMLDFEPVQQAISGTGAALGQEDPSTDGRLLLLDGASDVSTTAAATGLDDGMANGALHIISIEDPTDIRIVGVHPTTDHTWTCVTDVESGNGCAYAYGRSDNIIDIRDPANPVAVDTGWATATGEGGYAHDLTEVRPGLVMHAGAQPVLMDTTDPANPVKISHITLADHDSPNDDLYEQGPTNPLGQREWTVFGYHSVEWANGGTDDFLVMGTEIASASAPVGSGSITAGDDCNGRDQAVIETWDARPVLEALDLMDQLKAEGATHEEAREAAFGDGNQVKFIRLDSYAAGGAGTFTTGQAATNVLYCAHWMEPNPGWSNGGMLAVGYYNRGVRFVNVDSDGIMTEHGWLTGADAYTGSAQWIDDQVVYVMDYVRGMDIVKVSPEAATTTYTGTGSVHESALTIAEMESMGIAPPLSSEESVPVAAFTLAGAVLLMGAALRRRRATATA